jgi:glycosyltransferase involved in cell wall biosynthesis
VRVLFVNDTARNGGPGRSLHSILKFLDPIVVHRAVVLPRPGAISELLTRDRVADELFFEPALVENPIEPWGRPMTRSDFEAPGWRKAGRLVGNALKASLALTRLGHLLRRGAFDLLYCNGTNADFAGGALAALTHVPALWHVRYSSLPRAVVGLHRQLSGGKRVRRVVCVSAAAARLFEHCAGKVRVIHNGLDVAEFDPTRMRPTLRAELGLAPDAIIFGSHGRVLRRKGYLEMVRAAAVALARMDPQVRLRTAFVIVGDTPDDFRPDHVSECRALAASLGIAAQFHMLGFRSDVRPLVADFDVAVVPSVYPDPLPRSVIESMALGKPVIAFDVGGVVEMIEDGVGGELVRFEAARPDAEGASEAAIGRLAEAMLRYGGADATSVQRRARQGEAARDRVIKKFDARGHARAIEREIMYASGLSCWDE